MEEMKILLITTDPKCTYSLGLEREFKRMGHHIITFGRDEYLGLSRRFRVFSMMKALPAFYQLESIKANLKLKKLASLSKPDIVLTNKGEEIFPSTIKWLKQKQKTKNILWSPDDPQLFDRVSKYISKPYDFVFTSSLDCVDKYKSVGVKRVEYIPFFCIPSIDRPLKLTEEDKRKYKCDLSFIGKIYPEREKVIKSMLSLNIDIRIYGFRWNYSDREVMKRYLGSPDDEGYRKILNASKIVLNIHINPMRFGGATNLRVFEATGCKSFLLTDKPRGLEDMFETRKEIETYQNENELIEKIKYYLNNPKERQKIAKKGHERAYRDHTAEKRVKRIIEIIEEI